MMKILGVPSVPPSLPPRVCLPSPQDALARRLRGDERDRGRRGGGEQRAAKRQTGRHAQRRRWCRSRRRQRCGQHRSRTHQPRRRRGSESRHRPPKSHESCCHGYLLRRGVRPRAVPAARRAGKITFLLTRRSCSRARAGAGARAHARRGETPTVDERLHPHSPGEAGYEIC